MEIEVWFHFDYDLFIYFPILYYCWIMSIDHWWSKQGIFGKIALFLHFLKELLDDWPCMTLCGMVHLWWRCLFYCQYICDGLEGNCIMKVVVMITKCEACLVSYSSYDLVCIANVISMWITRLGLVRHIPRAHTRIYGTLRARLGVLDLSEVLYKPFDIIHRIHVWKVVRN